ncbi:UDP-glucuronic acid decarboxylase family protein [Pseudovibrio exalbescens]|uniref:NAD-dependent dehydratase n=1 Tax=Pseudovibrio exalbescens TaxID=197461 RepID=A0A1U7JJC7_9HYPH|nr:UDP-glucuronic acid decarboxylase family protein [Pseudovibrio exalbescens]OKL44846.1 NAD-dependent dehydratase [Pseudovibrio exalbescens]
MEKEDRLKPVWRAAPTPRHVVIAGGGGFIGTNLTRRLLQDGYRVTVLENYYSCAPGNLQELMQHPAFTLRSHDITESVVALDLGEVDEVYNLACPASPPHYQRDPIFTLNTCFNGTRHLLDLAVRENARYVQASTSEVYGDPQVHPQPESYWGYVNPVGIRACYDEGKRVAEALCVEYARQFGVDVRIARIFNTYGPHMDPNDGRVVSNFIVQALRGQDLTVYGNGLQTRSFCFVDDMIAGLRALMQVADAPNGPVNLGNPAEFTMLELAELVLELVPSRGRLLHEPLPQDDPQRRRPDISRARALLGWQPEVSLQQGLAKTVQYFDGRLRAEMALATQG